MKILSIDGGGIKGLFSAAFLAGLEVRFQRQIADCFDLIAGTSTGGILALALASRIPAKRIVDFYREWGPQIFPPRFHNFRLLRSLLVAKYNNKILEKAFKEVFQNLKIQDIYEDGKAVALCIPSINAVTGIPRLFKTAHDPNLTADNEYYLWQIALATSAAPTFFPLARIPIPNSDSTNLFVDGGLWANNPSLVALVEALTYAKAKIEDIHILSVGNITNSTTFKSNTLTSKGALLWGQKVVSLTLEAQSFAIHQQMRLLFNSLNMSSRYIRIEQDISSEAHRCLKELDCATKANLNDLEVYGHSKSDFEGVKKEIIAFFKERD